MKKLILTAVIAGLCSGLSAQIVQNGNFEYSPMPPHYQQVDPPNFFQPTFAGSWDTPNDGSPDLLSTNSTIACGSQASSVANPDHATCYPQVCAWTNLFGYQMPRGNANYNYVGIEPTEEYIHTSISQLVAGACYTMQFWVSRGDLSPEAFKMQALLSYNSLADQNHHGVMDSAYYSTDPNAYVLTSPDFIYSKTQWTLVQFNFKATGYERYLTIGVFDKNGVRDPITGVLSSVSITDYDTPGDCGPNGSSNPCGPEIPNSNQNPPPHCQHSEGLSYYYIDDVSIQQVGQSNFQPDFVFANAIISSFTFTGKKIMLAGNCTVSGNVIFNNCEVICNNNASITVPSGSQFHIRGINGGESVLYAGCDMMWNGIANHGIIEIDHSRIEDAKTALKCFNQSTWQVSQSEFNKNAIDIDIDGENSLPSWIKSSVFDHSIALRDPSQGTNGFGTLGVRVNGLQNGTGTISVGGSGSGEGCRFIKGQYGIISDLSNMTIKACSFTDIAVRGIEFTNNATGKRSLTVSNNSSFTHIPLAIFSHNLTNLTVAGSSFNNCGSGINWYDNFDCDLMVGDTLNAALGNSFTGCTYPVQCWNNKSTAGSNNELLNPQTPGIYTDINIQYNTMHGLTISADSANPIQMGIGIFENSASSIVSYHTCNVSANLITEAVKGIEFGNATGWAMYFQTSNYPTSAPDNKIENNGIALSTQTNPNARGINIKASSGWNIPANGISSDAAGNWQNVGIYLENSEYSEMVGNAVNAGTGIVIAQDVLNSNVHCNSLSGNSCGINLASARLRPAGMRHGKYLQNNQWQAYNNYFTNPNQPWAVDIQNYYSPTNQNIWVWDTVANSNFPKVWNAAAAGFEINMTGSALIDTTIGGDSCAYSPVYGGTIFDVPFASGSNVASTLSDPVAQWIADYYYEIRRLNTGEGSSSQASQNIKTIIAIQNAMGQRNFAEASYQMGLLSPANTVETNMKNVLAVLIAVNSPAIRTASSTEKNTLIAVAQQSSRTGGLAVYMARAYLFVHYKMNFEDEDYTGEKVEGIATVKTPCSIDPSKKTTISFIDENGYELDMPGAVIQPGGSFTFDPFQIGYYSQQNPSATYRIYAKFGSAYTVVNKEYKTLDEWKSLSPIAIDLSGVKIAVDSSDTSPVMVIDNYTEFTDAEGNVYTVGATTGNPDADFEIVKRDNSSNIIWTRTWNGPVSGNDTATCIWMDQAGYIYVAGKVWNGRSYDIQALKYDSDGFLLWSSLQDDKDKRMNTPTGIMVDEADNTVHIAANAGTAYRYIKYWQCVPSGLRTAQPGAEPQAAEPVLAEVDFYPNPSEGIIYLNLNNQKGGLLELYSTTGQLVYSLTVNQSGTVEFPESEVADGIYLIKFTITNTSSQVSKLVIQRNK